MIKKTHRLSPAFSIEATLAELRAWLAAEHEASASDALMYKTLRKPNLTLKKLLRPCEQDRQDVAEACTEWRKQQRNSTPVATDSGRDRRRTRDLSPSGQCLNKNRSTRSPEGLTHSASSPRRSH